MRALSPEVRAIVESLECDAEENMHLITRPTATEAGLSHSAIRRLCAAGRWAVRHDGVYAVAGRDGGPFQHVYAALLAVGPRAFAQRRTAAAIQRGLDLDWHGQVDIAVTRGGSSRRARRRVPERHIVEIDRMPCTDGLLTILDLAGVLDATEWEWALEAALRARFVTIDAIVAALQAPATRRDLVAVALVEEVLRLRPTGAPPTGSVLETRFVQLARAYGLPTPVRQHCVEISPAKRYFVDFAWPERRFFLEVDGGHHDAQGVHDADRLASIVLATGWNHVVLRWSQIVRTPRYTAGRIARLLDLASLSS